MQYYAFEDYSISHYVKLSNQGFNKIEEFLINFNGSMGKKM